MRFVYDPVKAVLVRHIKPPLQLLVFLGQPRDKAIMFLFLLAVAFRQCLLEPL